MTIDWHKQWTLFAENFHDGKAHIPIGDKTLFLSPGPGFGDLSHPTTRLMIHMMKRYVPKENIIDIGTGSGILALAALLMGAKSAFGIDIDPEAIQHARENGKLNQLKAQFGKTLPSSLKGGNIFLMNMILSEQRQVGPERLIPFGKLWIISGILTSQKEKFLLQSAHWRLKVVEETQESEWSGFILK